MEGETLLALGEENHSVKFLWTGLQIPNEVSGLN